MKTHWNLCKDGTSVGNDIEAIDIWDACKQFVERFECSGINDGIEVRAEISNGGYIVRIKIANLYTFTVEKYEV